MFKYTADNSTGAKMWHEHAFNLGPSHSSQATARSQQATTRPVGTPMPILARLGAVHRTISPVPPTRAALPMHRRRQRTANARREPVLLRVYADHSLHLIHVGVWLHDYAQIVQVVFVYNSARLIPLHKQEWNVLMILRDGHLGLDIFRAYDANPIAGLPQGRWSSVHNNQTRLIRLQPFPQIPQFLSIR